MTVFIWDASSYDGLIARAAMDRARAEGIVAFTHRLTRQGGLLDPYAGANLATARDSGIELIGAYAVTYTSGGSAQAELTVHYADQVAPWWRTYPGWFWQTDLEKWSTDPVPAGVGIGEAQQLESGTGRICALYASHGQYQNSLTSWSGPLWNADYTGHPAAGFVAMYPGDNWRPSHGSWTGGWSAYSGREPDFLQYTSSATIGGLTTCDASAYRGTPAQLEALLTGRGTSVTTSPYSPATATALAIGATDVGWVDKPGEVTWDSDLRIYNLRRMVLGDDGGTAGEDTSKYNLRALLAAVTSAGGLTDADRALIAENTAAVRHLSAQIAAAGAVPPPAA